MAAALRQQMGIAQRMKPRQGAAIILKFNGNLQWKIK
jgi:hypothetical protein